MAKNGKNRDGWEQSVEKLDPIEVVKRTFRQSQRDDVPGLASELAFRFFLALFPFFIFLGAIGSFVAGLFGINNPADQIVSLLGSNLPQGARETVHSVVADTLSNKSTSLISFTVVGAIWAATGGTNALIKAMNRAYDVGETRPFWKRYLTALWMTLLAAPLMLLAFFALVLAQTYGSAIASSLGMGDVFRTAVFWLRWPVVALVVSVVAAVLYRLAPNLELPWRWLTPGAVLFSIGWLVATYVFGIYVSNFSSYSNVYGVLGGVAVLMIWFYITAIALLLGAEVNAVVDKIEAPGRVQEEQKKNKEETKQEKAA